MSAESLGNVVVAGLFPHEDVLGILGWADACLVSLARAPNLSIDILSGFSTHMGPGAIIAAASGDPTSIVESAALGILSSWKPQMACLCVGTMCQMDSAAGEVMSRASRAAPQQFLAYDKGLLQALASL